MLAINCQLVLLIFQPLLDIGFTGFAFAFPEIAFHPFQMFPPFTGTGERAFFHGSHYAAFDSFKIRADSICPTNNFLIIGSGFQ